MALQNVDRARVFLGSYVKRFSSNFGISSSATSVEFDLIPGSPTSPVDVSGTDTGGIPATGFDYDGALPGNVSGFEWGNFNFVGIIQSWRESFGADGRTFSVQMADPRVIFQNVHLALDGDLGIDVGYVQSSGLKNYFDPLHYYSNKVDADINANGIRFQRVVDYLNDSGIIHAYDSTFQLRFASGWMPSGDASNPSGIPNWYRISASKMSLDQMLSQAAGDFALDYFVVADYDAYQTNPTGIIPLDIKLINRVESAGDLSEINDFIAGAEASGTLVRYSRGQDLRNEATSAVVLGPAKTFWQTPQTTQNEIMRYWGRSNAGFPLVTPHDSDEAIIPLDHITGSRAEDITSTINLTGRVYFKTPNPSGDLYPPRIVVSSSGEEFKGYMANDLILRAALYSQDSWEEVLYRENQSFAEQIGIAGSGGYHRVLPRTEFLNRVNEIPPQFVFARANTPIYQLPSGYVNRPDDVSALVESVYEATRSIAQEYYGRQWMVKLGDSTLVNQSFFGTEFVPEIEFGINDAAWSQGFGGGAYPNNVTNHELLHRYGNTNFRDNVGRLKAFCSFPDFDAAGGYIAGDFPYKIDTSTLDRGQLFIEQGRKLVMPIQVQALDIFPASGIVVTPVPIEALPEVTGYQDRMAFYEFATLFGYTGTELDPCGQFDIINRGNDNFDFGLAPARAPYLRSIPENHGIHIPMISNREAYGPFIQEGTRSGGVVVQNNGDLVPWSFGSITNFREAGDEYVSITASPTTVVSAGDLVIAGAPIFNIGDPITDTARITGLSMQVGADGLTTNYSLRTYVLPPSRLNKILQDRIQSVFVEQSKDRRDIIRIDRELKKIEENLFKELNRKLQDAKDAVQEEETSGGSQDYDHEVERVEPAVEEEPED